MLLINRSRSSGEDLKSKSQVYNPLDSDVKVFKSESSSFGPGGQQVRSFDYTAPREQVTEPPIMEHKSESEEFDRDLPKQSSGIKQSSDQSYEVVHSRNITKAEQEEMLRKTESNDDDINDRGEFGSGEGSQGDVPFYLQNLKAMEKFGSSSPTKARDLQHVPEGSKESQDYEEEEESYNKPSESKYEESEVHLDSARLQGHKKAEKSRKEVPPQAVQKRKEILKKGPSFEGTNKSVTFKHPERHLQTPSEKDSKQETEEQLQEQIEKPPQEPVRDEVLEPPVTEEEKIPQLQEEEVAPTPEEQVENEGEVPTGQPPKEEEKQLSSEGEGEGEQESDQDEERSHHFGGEYETPVERSERTEEDEHPYQGDRENMGETPVRGDDDDEIGTNQSFGRQDPQKHITVTNQDQDIIDFRNALDLKYETFKRNLVEKYKNIRLEYLKQMDYAIRANERENNSAIDFMEQQLEEGINERNAAIQRATESRIIFANIMREKYNTFYAKRACFQSWKYYYEWKKYKVAKSKFCDNYYRKRSLQKLLNGWRKVSHEQFLDKAFKIRDEYELQQRNKIFQVDNKIENLILYLSQLQAKIEEETGLVLEIPNEYQEVLNSGIGRVKQETDTLRGTELFNEVKMTQTEAIFKS